MSMTYHPEKAGGTDPEYEQYIRIANGQYLDGYNEGDGVYWAIRRAARDVAIGMMRAAAEAGATYKIRQALVNAAKILAPD